MWMIESDFVDVALQMHRFVLVNHAVKDAGGQPARRTYDYMLGSGHSGQSCAHSHGPVHLGHVLHQDGKMRDGEGNVVTARAMALKHVNELNGHHARLKEYVRHHRVKTGFASAGRTGGSG